MIYRLQVFDLQDQSSFFWPHGGAKTSLIALCLYWHTPYFRVLHVLKE